jgi:hypothetical protein
MLKINQKKHEIAMVGDSRVLKDEIGTLMLAFVGESAKRSKEAALDVYNHYVRTMASIAGYLDNEFDIDVTEEEEEEAPPIDKELDDAIDAFCSALDNIIGKKKGDK